MLSQSVSAELRFWLLLLLSVYGIKFAQRQLGRLFMVGVLLVIMVQNLDTLISSYHP